MSRCDVSVVDIKYIGFFFFKQKTAYEMLRSLVGSEMCIRDSPRLPQDQERARAVHQRGGLDEVLVVVGEQEVGDCLLYTSDAADDLLCVDLGGGRSIKKKNKQKSNSPPPHICKQQTTCPTSY